jgi:hypothetical protein
MIQPIKTTTEHEHHLIGLGNSTGTNEQPEQVDAPKNSIGSVARGDVTSRPR